MQGFSAIPPCLSGSFSSNFSSTLISYFNWSFVCWIKMCLCLHQMAVSFFLSCSADSGIWHILPPNVLKGFLYCYLVTHVTDEKLFIKNKSLSLGNNYWYDLFIKCLGFVPPFSECVCESLCVYVCGHYSEFHNILFMISFFPPHILLCWNLVDFLSLSMKYVFSLGMSFRDTVSKYIGPQ